MSRLNKKLDELSSLLKQFNASIKVPKPPDIKKPSVPKAPGIAPKSQKDPVKIAEQIKNQDMKPMIMDQAKTIKESLKVSKSGQWQIQKNDDDDVTAKILADQEKDVDIGQVKPFTDAYNKRPEQQKLISGINFNSKKDKLHEDQASGVSGESGWYTSKDHPDNVWIKSSASHPNFVERGHDKLSSARREVLFHNMANDFFDMGKYVPTTAGFSRNADEYSAQVEVKGGKHVSRSPPLGKDGKTELPKEYTETLNKKHKSGDLHKLAMMDTIMGHHDRHRGNFMYDPKDSDKLYLIDNGTAFDYSNFDVREAPHFWDHAVSDKVKDTGNKDELHSEAKKWLLNLSPKKAQDLMEAHGHYQSDPHSRGFVQRLKHMQDVVKSGKYKDFKDLLKENKYSTGPSWHDKKKKGA